VKGLDLGKRDICGMPRFAWWAASKNRAQIDANENMSLFAMAGAVVEPVFAAPLVPVR
jgi:hypothetical protein